MKHEKMNAIRKPTKGQRLAKHARKLGKDTSQDIRVDLFYLRDIEHPYHRVKVDLNAQQNGITGGVLECKRNNHLNFRELTREIGRVHNRCYTPSTDVQISSSIDTSNSDSPPKSESSSSPKTDDPG
jgi:hypothetical protein